MVAVLEHMEDGDLISVENGRWQINTPLEKIDLEAREGLGRMIEHQIEGLSEGEQRVLEAATLEGIGHTRFSVASRAALIDMEPQAFEDICETLCRRHRIVRGAGSVEFPDGTISACYEFVHTLYREVCYRRISPGPRAKLPTPIGLSPHAHCDRLYNAPFLM